MNDAEMVWILRRCAPQNDSAIGAGNQFVTTRPMGQRKEIMKANFYDIHAAADYIGPGAIEVPIYQTEITDIVRRHSISASASSRFRRRVIHPATLRRRRFRLQRLQLGLWIRATLRHRLSVRRAWNVPCR